MAGYGENDELVGPAPSGGYGPNDVLDTGKSTKPSSILRRAGDYGVSALKGTIALPEAAVGLADIATGGRAGKAAEEAGFRPKEAKAMLEEYLTPEQQAANRAVAETEGFLPKIGAALKHPSTIAQTVVESAPLMVGGGGIARGVLATAPKVAPYLAGAIGEGVVGAGSAAEQIRQETETGTLGASQAAAALASGAGTALFGAAGGKFTSSELGRKLGLADIDTMIAQGGAPAASAAAAKQGFVKKIVASGISEGAFEELPQSVQEQMWQNAALDKPLLEGVSEQAAMGLLAGGVMGGGAAGVAHMTQRPAVTPPAVPETPLGLPERAAIPVEGVPLDEAAIAANEQYAAEVNAAREAEAARREEAFKQWTPATAQDMADMGYIPPEGGFTPEQVAAYNKEQKALWNARTQALKAQRRGEAQARATEQAEAARRTAADEAIARFEAEQFDADFKRWKATGKPEDGGYGAERVAAFKEHDAATVSPQSLTGGMLSAAVAHSPTVPEEISHAIQEPSPAKVGAQPERIEGARSEGGQGVGQGEQRVEAAAPSEARSTAPARREPTAEAPVAPAVSPIRPHVEALAKMRVPDETSARKVFAAAKKEAEALSRGEPGANVKSLKTRAEVLGKMMGGKYADEAKAIMAVHDAVPKAPAPVRTAPAIPAAEVETIRAEAKAAGMKNAAFGNPATLMRAIEKRKASVAEEAYQKAANEANKTLTPDEVADIEDAASKQAKGDETAFHTAAAEALSKAVRAKHLTSVSKRGTLTASSTTENAAMSAAEPSVRKSMKPRVAENAEDLHKWLKDHPTAVSKEGHGLLTPHIKVVGMPGLFRVALGGGYEKIGNGGMTAEKASKSEVADIDDALEKDQAEIVLMSRWGGSGRATDAKRVEVLHSPSGMSFKNVDDWLAELKPLKSARPPALAPSEPSVEKGVTEPSAALPKTVQDRIKSAEGPVVVVRGSHVTGAEFTLYEKGNRVHYSADGKPLQSESSGSDPVKIALRYRTEDDVLGANPAARSQMESNKEEIAATRKADENERARREEANRVESEARSALEESLEGVKFKKTSFEPMGGDGKKAPAISGGAVGALVAHKSLGHFVRGQEYTVSHARTGFAVLQGFKSLDAAKKAAVRLDRAGPFDTLRSADDLKKDEFSKIRAIGIAIKKSGADPLASPTLDAPSLKSAAPATSTAPSGKTIADFQPLARDYNLRLKDGHRVEVVQSAPRTRVSVTEGVYHTGKTVYIVADSLPNVTRAKQVIEHELAHMAAARVMTSAEYARVVTAIQNMDKLGNANIRRLGTKVDATQPGLDADTRAKEILAMAVEDGTYKQSGVLSRLVTRILEAYRRIARSMGFNADGMTEGEVWSSINRAMRGLYEPGGARAVQPGEPAVILSSVHRTSAGPIIQDPTRDQARNMLARSEHGELRGLRDSDGSLYIWDASKMIHAGAAAEVGLGKNFSGRLNFDAEGLKKLPEGTFSGEPGYRTVTGGSTEVSESTMAEFEKAQRRGLPNQRNGDPDPAEAHRVEAGIKGKDPIEAARFIAETGTPDQRLIASKVLTKLEELQQAGTRLKINIVQPRDTAPVELENARGHTFGDLDEITIWLNGSGMTGRVGVEYETLLHELVHMATAGTIEAAQVFPSSKFYATGKELERVGTAIAEHITERFRSAARKETTLTPFEIDLKAKSNNAFVNDHEVIAWALSSRDAQTYLEGIPYQGGTLWSKFVQAVRTLLGLPASSDTALSEVLRISERLLTPNAGYPQRNFSAPNIRMSKQTFKGDMGWDTRPRSSYQPSPEESRMDAFIRKFQNSLVRFDRLQHAVFGEKVPDAANVTQASSIMQARVANQTEDFNQKVVHPLIERTRDAGLTLDQVAEYLEMRHVPERNERMREIHRDPEATGNGVTDKEAKEAVARFEAQPNGSALKKIAAEWQAITKDSLRMRLDAGLIDRETYDTLLNTYRDYVPLRGGDEDIKTGTGKGLSVSNKSKRAMGHAERAEWVLENIIKSHLRAIYETEKNKVGETAANLLQEANNAEIGTVGLPVKRQVMKNDASYTVTWRGEKAEAFKTKSQAEQYIHLMVETQGRKRKDFKTKVSYDPFVSLMATPQLADNETQYFKDGKAIRLQWNDPYLARAATNGGVERLAGVLAGAKAFNSYLSKAYTAYSPTFAPKNMLRDITSGFINLTGDYGVKTAARVIGHYASSLRDLSRSMNDPSKSEWVTRYRAAGGNIGAAYLSDLERIGDDALAKYHEYAGARETFNIVKAQSLANGRTEQQANRDAAIKAGKAAFSSLPVVGHFLSLMQHINGVTENALRLATFRTLVEEGRSDAEAAMASKNATVNFNTKGELSNQAGAMYLFFNPSVQGTARLLHALTDSKYRNQARGLAGMMVIGAFAAAEASRGGDDEDEKRWKRTPDGIKDRNLIVTINGEQVLIPIPYGYGVFHTLGNVLSDYLHGADGWKLGTRLAGAVADNLSPVGNPITDKGLSAAQVLPTIPKMALAPQINENAFGQPIMPEKYSEAKPDSATMYRATKGTVYADIAEGLNALTGGSRYEKGMVDASPETIKFYVNALTGGTGKFFADTVNLTAVTAKGATPELREVPIASAFVREPGISDSRKAFWESSKEAHAAAERFAMARVAKDREAMIEMMREEGDLINLAKVATRFEKLVKTRRDLVDAIKANDNLSLDEKREQIKTVEAQEDAIYNRFLDTFAARRKL